MFFIENVSFANMEKGYHYDPGENWAWISIADIGHHFPPSDESNRGRPSADFLRFALERMQNEGYAITNIDCNIICELPRIAPVREEIRKKLAELMGVSVKQISVKGRTNEKVDAAGEGRAVICQAAVLLTASGENR